MVTYFDANRKSVCEFLLVNNTNVHSISHDFEIISDYWSTHKLTTTKFGIKNIVFDKLNCLVVSHQSDRQRDRQNGL